MVIFIFRVLEIGTPTLVIHQQVAIPLGTATQKLHDMLMTDGYDFMSVLNCTESQVHNKPNSSSLTIYLHLKLPRKNEHKKDIGNNGNP